MRVLDLEESVKKLSWKSWEGASPFKGVSVGGELMILLRVATRFTEIQKQSGNCTHHIGISEVRNVFENPSVQPVLIHESVAVHTATAFNQVRKS